MTTYGTIQTIPIGSSNLEFFSRTKDQVRTALSTRRPWAELLRPGGISLPAGVRQALGRIRANTAYFQMNYTIFVLFVLFLSLLWHPISLIVFVVTMAAWFFLYFLRDEPITAFNRTIDHRLILVALSVLTITLLFLTHATVNIVAALAVSIAVLVLHGALRRTDNLDLDDDECGAGFGDMRRRISLKETASASYSSSS
ncbi:hypothetical protein NMG60_11021977 [Bertholletia excelsa]